MKSNLLTAFVLGTALTFASGAAFAAEPPATPAPLPADIQASIDAAIAAADANMAGSTGSGYIKGNTAFWSQITNKMVDGLPKSAEALISGVQGFDKPTAAKVLALSIDILTKKGLLDDAANLRRKFPELIALLESGEVEPAAGPEEDIEPAAGEDEFGGDVGEFDGALGENPNQVTPVLP